MARSQVSLLDGGICWVICEVLHGHFVKEAEMKSNTKLNRQNVLMITRYLCFIHNLFTMFYELATDQTHEIIYCKIINFLLA